MYLILYKVQEAFYICLDTIRVEDLINLPQFGAVEVITQQEAEVIEGGDLHNKCIVINYVTIKITNLPP